MVPPQNGEVTGDPSQIVEIGFNDIEPLSVAERWASYMTWTSEKVFTDASQYSPWVDNVPEAYIHTESDHALPYPVQLQMQALLPQGSPVYTINSSHVPFISQPDELLPLVENAISVAMEAKK